VTLQQEDELARELAFNEVGTYNGRSVIPIGIGPLKPGPVNLEVISSKEWTFEYTEELSSAARSTPFEFSGSGDDISPAIEFTPGTHAITVSYDGPEFQFFAVNICTPPMAPTPNSLPESTRTASKHLKVHSNSRLSLRANLVISPVRGSWMSTPVAIGRSASCRASWRCNLSSLGPSRRGQSAQEERVKRSYPGDCLPCDRQNSCLMR